MTIIIELTEEDICNITKIGGEINSSLPTYILDIYSNHYIIDSGAIKIDSADNVCTIDIDSKFLSYPTNSILDIISMFKMMSRIIMRMFDDKFNNFFNKKIVITKNGKPIESNICHEVEEVYNV